ncbi:MAG: universal stress protein [Burkholderiales bacterium]|jgi:nucleotide-binding universal stress UspA family protein
MKYRKILLAYNGSAEGKRALLECAELANFLGAETHLLAVASMPPSLFLTEGFVPEELLEEEKKRTQTVLDEGIASLKKTGFDAKGHLAVGEPVEEICRLAKELSVDLIVVGHNQKTSFAARWWKGSVGASIIDYAPCSLLVALSRN